MLLWADTETNGLMLPSQGHLLELALVVTDDQLNEVAHCHGPICPVGMDIDDVPMDDFVRNMHTNNGLIADIKEHGFRRHEAEATMVAFLQKVFEEVPPVVSHECANCGKNEKDHVREPAATLVCEFAGGDQFAPKMLSALSQTPLAGSTISFDRGWIDEHMPLLLKEFHYRNVDVSTIVELSRRWAPEIYKARPKNEKGAAHRALADARESIAYLRYFRQVGFIGGVKYDVHEMSGLDISLPSGRVL